MPAQNIANDVQRLRSEGLSNEEIAQRLLYQGYSNADVFDALTNATVTPASEQGANMDYDQNQQQSFPQMPPPPRMEMDTNKIEEIAESIIDEKWNDLVDHVNRIIEWKSSMEMKLAGMEEQLKNLRSDFELLNKSIMGKINDNDSVMREVGTDIKALEQVFKKILPGFVENVNELSRITQGLKRK